MSDSKDRNKKRISISSVLHIPVWTGVIIALAIVVLYIILLTTTGKSRTIYKNIDQTATQQWVEGAVTQTISARNEQGTATQAALATKTPTATPTLLPATSTPTPTATPALGIGSTQISPIDGMTLQYVPKGTFMMGYEAGDSSSKPVHEVFLDAYWIDRTEVSNAMYVQCVAAGNCTEPASKKSSTKINYFGNPDFDEFPVIYVTWQQSQEYCEWVGRKLPTEAQWEKAARGEDGRLYPWGDIVEDFNGNFSPLKLGFKAVGSYPGGASPYGALQMAGNAYEWVADWYDNAYYQIQETWVNPTGPMDGEMRTLRGGLFQHSVTYKQVKSPGGIFNVTWERVEKDVIVHFQTGFRMYFKPETASQLIGFRCATSAP